MVAGPVVDTDRVPRIARVVAAGVPHHITQRGNNRQQIFFSDRDRRFYLTLLRGHAERHGLRGKPGGKPGRGEPGQPQFR